MDDRSAPVWSRWWATQEADVAATYAARRINIRRDVGMLEEAGSTHLKPPVEVSCEVSGDELRIVLGTYLT